MKFKTTVLGIAVAGQLAAFAAGGSKPPRSIFGETDAQRAERMFGGSMTGSECSYISACTPFLRATSG